VAHVRRHTSSELRFLLTERAALAGSVTRISRDCLPLEAEVFNFEAQARKARERLEATHLRLGALQAELEALDLVLRHSFPGVDPASVSAVSAWAGKYGRRGELKAFIHATIKAAHPAGVPTQALLEAILTRFTLSSTKEDFIRLRHGVVKLLSRSKAAGLVQSQPGKKLSSSVWFWCQSSPGLAQLLEAAARSRRDQDPHIFRGEVGG
jgi:hypothetical protein